MDAPCCRCDKADCHIHDAVVYATFCCVKCHGKDGGLREELRAKTEMLEKKEEILKGIEEDLFLVCTRELGFPALLHKSFCEAIVEEIRSLRKALREVVKSACFGQVCGTGYVEDRMAIPVHVYNEAKSAIENDLRVHNDPA